MSARFMFWLIVVVVVESLVGCARNSYIPLAELSPIEPDFFSKCDSGGAAEVSLYQDNNFVFTVEVDWSIVEPANWRMELSDRLGRNAGYVSYFASENVISTSGVILGGLPKIETDRNGFLVVDGHFVGVQARDLPCILAGTIPSRWLSKVVRKDMTTQSQAYQIIDGPVTVESSIEKSDRRTEDFCFLSSWARWWVFRQKLKVCKLKQPTLTRVEFATSVLKISTIQ